MLVNITSARNLEAPCGSSGSPALSGGGEQRFAPIASDRISQCCPPPVGPGESPLQPQQPHNPIQPLLDAISARINAISSLVGSLGNTGAQALQPATQPQPPPPIAQQPFEPISDSFAPPNAAGSSPNAQDPLQQILEAIGAFITSLGGPLAKLFGQAQNTPGGVPNAQSTPHPSPVKYLQA